MQTELTSPLSLTISADFFSRASSCMSFYPFTIQKQETEELRAMITELQTKATNIDCSWAHRGSGEALLQLQSSTVAYYPAI